MCWYYACLLNACNVKLSATAGRLNNVSLTSLLPIIASQLIATVILMLVMLTMMSIFIMFVMAIRMAVMMVVTMTLHTDELTADELF